MRREMTPKSYFYLGVLVGIALVLLNARIRLGYWWF